MLFSDSPDRPSRLRRLLRRFPLSWWELMLLLISGTGAVIYGLQKLHERLD